MATLYDVCEKTGLSTATVSRVINGSGLVKEATRERVHQAMKELNYRPNQAARKLAGGKTDTIGIILPLLDNGYYVKVLRGIDNVSTKEKLKLLISFYHSETDLLDYLQSLCREGRTDAIILMNNTFFGPDKVRELAGDDIPIALIGQNGINEGMDSVLIDNFQGAYRAVTHLLENKPQSLLLLTGPKDNHDSNKRLEGAQQAIQDASLEIDVKIVTGDFYHEGGRKAFEEYVGRQNALPEAIFAFNDAMALGVLDVLAETEKRIPEDIQLIGFDNNEIGQYIGLSTVSFPMEQIGETATRLVAERIKNKDLKPSSISMETSLIPRKTTR
ncbi:LacI family DNA-binding transcriptional regulator [Pontiellaceae bacterium B1224]|nr:LacI family DNA-binding transcriptional regulator [Pontiellaceae bacterium B1224]